MREISIAMAKLSGVRKSLTTVLGEHVAPGRPRTHFDPQDIGRYFDQAAAQVRALQQEIPLLFDDFHQTPTSPDIEAGAPPQLYYSRDQIQRLARDIDQIFELRANSEIVQSNRELLLKRVFVTHGRSNDWREVQSFIEKDVKLETMELAQEANLGMTVIEKLHEGADRCDSAVIVMTGDDTDANGLARARENVMHEIGFFQGKYGRAKVIVLHEDGVSIPTNLSGVVYIPFPHGTVSAGFHVLQRELAAIYKKN